MTAVLEESAFTLDDTLRRRLEGEVVHILDPRTTQDILSLHVLALMLYLCITTDAGVQDEIEELQRQILPVEEAINTLEDPARTSPDGHRARLWELRRLYDRAYQVMGPWGKEIVRLIVNLDAQGALKMDPTPDGRVYVRKWNNYVRWLVSS